ICIIRTAPHYYPKFPILLVDLLSNSSISNPIEIISGYVVTILRQTGVTNPHTQQKLLSFFNPDHVLVQSVGKKFAMMIRFFGVKTAHEFNKAQRSTQCTTPLLFFCTRSRRNALYWLSRFFIGTPCPRTSNHSHGGSLSFSGLASATPGGRKTTARS